MEPENALLEKEKHLQTTIFWVPCEFSGILVPTSGQSEGTQGRPAPGTNGWVLDVAVPIFVGRKDVFQEFVIKTLKSDHLNRKQSLISINLTTR